MPLSLVPADPQVREVGLPSTVPHAAWKPGYVYSLVTEILKRPGTEAFQGIWTGMSAPHALGRREPIELITLQ
jgi:hypothetical protein